jgi:hypothetical protein
VLNNIWKLMVFSHSVVDFKVGICKFLRLLMEVMCVIPLILAVIMMGDTPS